MTAEKDPGKFQLTGPVRRFEFAEIAGDYEDLVRKLGELGYRVIGSDFGDTNPVDPAMIAEAELIESGEDAEEEM
jgi:hypothetical protein